jgi:hypothetical protein
MPITQLMGYIYIGITKVNAVFQQLNLINELETGRRGPSRMEFWEFGWLLGQNAKITQELSSYWFNPRVMHFGASIFKTSLGIYIYRHPLQWISHI